MRCEEELYNYMFPIDLFIIFSKRHFLTNYSFSKISNNTYKCALNSRPALSIFTKKNEIWFDVKLWITK